MRSTPTASLARPPAADFRVVCLGGSAGGLEAYRAILRGLPADTGMAYVVAAHRFPAHAELLGELLRAVTTMPVVDVTEGMRLEPNRVFLMPPRLDLSTSGDVFHLRTTPKPPGWPKTINLFLFSLAEALGRRAVAVILSGLDGDGSGALKAIKAAGGVTFAQSDATCDSMPRSAVETGHIDHLLPASEIAEALVALARQPLAAGPPSRFVATTSVVSAGEASSADRAERNRPGSARKP
jgi:chemotaxis response regulator CheB